MTKQRFGQGLLIQLCLLLAIIAVVPPAYAGSFQVNPIKLEISSSRPTTSLTLTNNGDAAVALRILTYKWDQKDGGDVYTETSNVITSPPIFTVEPGAKQLIRIGLRNRSAGEAYRVVIEEIPSDQLQENLVQVALRLDLPLFVLGVGEQPQVSWQAWREASGEISLEASNVGNRHHKVLTIDSVLPAGDIHLSDRMGVILPSSMRRWSGGMQPGVATGSLLNLKVRTPAGEEFHSVVVQQR